MDLNLAVLVGMVLAILVFGFSRGISARKHGVLRIVMLGVPSFVIGLCLIAAGVLSFLAGVTSAGTMLEFLAFAWFCTVAGGIWDEVKETLSNFKYKRRRAQERKLRQQTQDAFDQMSEDEKKTTREAAFNWKEANRGFPYVDDPDFLSVLYLESLPRPKKSA